MKKIIMAALISARTDGCSSEPENGVPGKSRWTEI